MPGRRDISSFIPSFFSPRKIGVAKQGSSSLRIIFATFCFFLCTLFAAVPVNADGVEVDAKTQKSSTVNAANGAATSRVSGNPEGVQPGTESEDGAIEEKGPKLSDFDLARYQYCGEDSDCVVELNGCCECETGAQEVAINKSRVEAFRAQFVGCAEVSCGPVTASEHCGGGVVSCVEHRCRFFPADEEI